MWCASGFSPIRIPHTGADGSLTITEFTSGYGLSPASCCRRELLLSARLTPLRHGGIFTTIAI